MSPGSGSKGVTDTKEKNHELSFHPHIIDKGFTSLQHCLVKILEKLKNTLDKSGFVCAIFMDLSNVFNAMEHYLLIGKLGTYSFQEDELFLVKSYFMNRQQHACVNTNFTMWEEIISGFLQG